MLEPDNRSDMETIDEARQRLKTGRIGCGLEVLAVRTRPSRAKRPGGSERDSFGEIVALRHGRC